MSEQPYFCCGYKIPSAYIPLDYNKVQGKNLKWRLFITIEDSTKYPFLFDPENKEYLEFQQRCREDTNKLQKELWKQLKSKETIFWGSYRSIPLSLRELKMEINIMIRPLFFKSDEVKKEDNRWQGKSALEFIIHVDELHNIQIIRYFLPAPIPKILLKFVKEGEINNSISYIVYLFHNQQSALQEAYGNWEDFARILIQKLSKVDDKINNQLSKKED